MKKKLVFTIGSLSGGGAERVVSILANSLCQDYEVTILALLKDDVQYHLDENVHYKYLELPNHLSGIRRNFHRLKLIRQTIKEINPDRIISFLTLINMMVLMALVFTGYPVIVSERNDPNAETPSRLGRLIRNLLYYSRKRIFFVFQTQYAKDCFRKMTEKNSAIIFNPIKKELPSPYQGERRKRIVCVARLEPAKNHTMLIKAFRRFKESFSGYTLEFYGKGPLESDLKNLVKELNLENDVIFHGFTQNVHQEILDAQLFILPSDYEGISNAMLEALAMGIPTISTDSPAYGARLFIEDGRSGFLTPVGDEGALLAKMRELAGDGALRDIFSNQSQKIKDILSEEKIIKEWHDVIEEF